MMPVSKQTARNLFAFSAGAIVGALTLTWVAPAPAEPPIVFRGFDAETLTPEDLVDEAEPHLRKYIDSEVPWLLRMPAHKLAKWMLRRSIHTQIALHGHQAASALRVIEPISDNLFRAEPAARIRGLRRLCESDPAEFGVVAVEAREASGPVIQLKREDH
jgi:hypothetical protein